MQLYPKPPSTMPITSVQFARGLQRAAPVAHSSIFSQCVPLPEKPAGQVQLNEPAVSVQSLASKQLCVPKAHSSS